MGALYLHHRSAEVQEAALACVFARKGFGKARRTVLGSWTLWHYPKQLLGRANYLECEDGAAVYVVGTPIYRGLGYAETLGCLLSDFRTGQLDQSAMLGNFALLFWVEQRLSLLTDTLGVCHVFTDKERTRFSTSFLALLASFPGKSRLNRLAVLEKLATGYVVGPETIVAGIERLTPRPGRGLESSGIAILTSPLKPVNLTETRATFGDAVSEQVTRLERYFADVTALGLQSGVDFGLSSGYDSRLVALLARRVFPDLSAHTHWVTGVHDEEKDRAQAIAKSLGIRLRIHGEPRFEQLPGQEINEALLDGLYYYDARAGDNSGAYSTTYTRRYKRLTLNGHRLRLNGEGGEIYRNYYHTSRSRVDFQAWMRHHLYYGPTPLALAQTGLDNEMTAHILRKLSARLDTDLRGSVQIAVTRAYYGEVRLPECEGVLANADMQLAHFLMPFAEPEIQRSAYRLTPHIGVSGRFEAAMIQFLNPGAAALASHYGFPISHEPLHHKGKAALRGILPDRFWLWRRARRFDNQEFGRSSADGYQAVRGRSRIVRESEDALHAFVPGFELRQAIREAPAKATAVFLGVFLREFAAHLKE